MTLPTADALAIETLAQPTHSARPSAPAAVCKHLQPTRSILLMVDQLTQLGGGERVLFELARQLPGHGFHVTVVTFRGDPDPAAFALCDTITILPFASCFSLEAGRVAFELRRLIRRERVGIVQTFFETSDTYGALVARLSGVRHIVSSRRDMGILRSKKHRAAYRLLGGVYSAVLAVSEQVRRKHLESDHLDPDRVQTVHNGISVERFAAPIDRTAVRRGLGLPIGVPLVTTIANINTWKGVDVYLRCAAVVHLAHPDAAFAIAGDWTDKPLVAALRELARGLGIADRVHFLGRIADVSPLLLASDAFALLSRSEGFPNVVLEAMAAGLPVVCTAVGGTPEAVDDGVTGFLVENEDERGAAAHITRLLSNKSLRQAVGRAGRERVKREFSMEEMIRKHVELYDALLASRS